MLNTFLIAAAVSVIAVPTFGQELNSTSVGIEDLTFGSNACMSGGFCEARAVSTPPEYFMVRGLSITKLNELNELIDIRAGQDIPAYTLVHMGPAS